MILTFNNWFNLFQMWSSFLATATCRTVLPSESFQFTISPSCLLLSPPPHRFYQRPQRLQPILHHAQVQNRLPPIRHHPSRHRFDPGQLADNLGSPFERRHVERRPPVFISHRTDLRICQQQLPLHLRVAFSRRQVKRRRAVEIQLDSKLGFQCEKLFDEMKETEHGRGVSEMQETMVLSRISGFSWRIFIRESTLPFIAASDSLVSIFLSPKPLFLPSLFPSVFSVFYDVFLGDRQWMSTSL